MDEDQFVDRHGDHSLNCMVICSPNGKAFYVSDIMNFDLDEVNQYELGDNRLRADDPRTKLLRFF